MINKLVLITIITLGIFTINGCASTKAPIKKKVVVNKLTRSELLNQKIVNICKEGKKEKKFEKKHKLYNNASHLYNLLQVEDRNSNTTDILAKYYIEYLANKGEQYKEEYFKNKNIPIIEKALNKVMDEYYKFENFFKGDIFWKRAFEYSKILLIQDTFHHLYGKGPYDYDRFYDNYDEINFRNYLIDNYLSLRRSYKCDQWAVFASLKLEELEYKNDKKKPLDQLCEDE